MPSNRKTVSGAQNVRTVELERISKRFGSTQAVRDVTLNFVAGEVHAVLGENGAGKSTVGKIMGGLFEPDKGRILVDGRAVRLRNVAEARERGFAMVFQELSLAPDLTVQENIHLGMEAGGGFFGLLDRAGEENRCRTLFKENDFDFDLDVRVRSLSVANQQLVEVVKALARRPSVLILDEPTAMLGVRENERLLRIIRRARAEGLAVIFITHHVEEVVAVADRVSLMKDGALVESLAMTKAIDADLIVTKLAGKARASDRGNKASSRGVEVLAIRNLPQAGNEQTTITVSAGEVVGLYGVVGSGCERLGRGVVGLDDIRPSAMTLAGKPYRPHSPARAARSGVSYLPSGRAANCILPSRSVRENLTITQLPQVASRGIIDNTAERKLTLSLLSRYRTRFANYENPITSLSGGNQQKVMIARCLGRASRLIVLEDPTAGVDIGSKQDIHELVRQRAAAGLAILLVSSDLRETIAISDVIYTVLRNRVVGRYERPGIGDEPRIVADVLGA
jgi:ribose transport system ATP-binding protein